MELVVRLKTDENQKFIMDDDKYWQAIDYTTVEADEVAAN